MEEVIEEVRTAQGRFASESTFITFPEVTEDGSPAHM